MRDCDYLFRLVVSIASTHSIAETDGTRPWTVGYSVALVVMFHTRHSRTHRSLVQLEGYGCSHYPSLGGKRRARSNSHGWERTEERTPALSWPHPHTLPMRTVAGVLRHQVTTAARPTRSHERTQHSNGRLAELRHEWLDGGASMKQHDEADRKGIAPHAGGRSWLLQR